MPFLSDLETLPEPAAALVPARRPSAAETEDGQPEKRSGVQWCHPSLGTTVRPFEADTYLLVIRSTDVDCEAFVMQVTNYAFGWYLSELLFHLYEYSYHPRMPRMNLVDSKASGGATRPHRACPGKRRGRIDGGGAAAEDRC